MQLFLPKDLKNKILLSKGKGFLIGKKLYDIFFINDVYFDTSKDKLLSIQNVIGEFYYLNEKSKKGLDLKRVLSNLEIPWIFLLIKGNEKVLLRGYLKTLSEDQKKDIVKRIKIVVI